MLREPKLLMSLFWFLYIDIYVDKYFFKIGFFEEILKTFRTWIINNLSRRIFYNMNSFN